MYLAICLCLPLCFFFNVLFIFNFLFLFVCLFVFFFAITCTQPEIEPTPSALEEHSLNHWIAREVPAYHYFLTLKGVTDMLFISFFQFWRQRFRLLNFSLLIQTVKGHEGFTKLFLLHTPFLFSLQNSSSKILYNLLFIVNYIIFPNINASFINLCSKQYIFGDLYYSFTEEYFVLSAAQWHKYHFIRSNAQFFFFFIS